MRYLLLNFCILVVLLFAALTGECQTSTRIAGKTPQKWITLKHSFSPGRVLHYDGQNYQADFEDIYAKIWLPVVITDRFKMAAGAFYRTEQIEFEDLTNSDLNTISHWNLRAAGVDIKTVSRISDQHSLMVGANLSYSATVQSAPLGSSPLNYTLSAAFMNRKSDNKEVGYGLLHSNNTRGIPVIPVFIWNETFSERHGIEISLPYKLAWRYNLSERNIFHIKAEGLRRNYFVNQENNKQCSRLDVDLGVAYTRLLNKWVGFELFSGYRQNLSSELPNEISMKTGSGLAVSVEVFVLPAFKK